MAIITLTTDFGVQDEFVGVMKGVILSINPDATVVDITHAIEPQDVMQGAYFIHAAYKYFPKGSIHVVVVDPGVGSHRSILAVEKHGHTFLAPDNGILSLVLEDGRADAVVRVDNSELFLKPVSRTFHGRDIFAPVAGHLSLGTEPAVVGTAMTVQSISLLSIPIPHINGEGDLMGRVIHVDRFGNMVTNVNEAYMDRLLPDRTAHGVDIQVGENRVGGIRPTFDTVPAGTPVAVFGSRGFLEIAVNRGDASKRWGVGKGDEIRISLRRR